MGFSTRAQLNKHTRKYHSDLAQEAETSLVEAVRARKRRRLSLSTHPYLNTFNEESELQLDVTLEPASPGTLVRRTDLSQKEDFAQLFQEARFL
jgi:hypothetical protein